MWYLNPQDEPTIRSERVVVKYEEYFEPMVGLTKRQLKRRVEMAEELDTLLFLLFLAWEYETDETEAENDFIKGYKDIVEKYDDVGLEDDFDEYITLLAASLHETTIRNWGDPYYTSFDRATFVAANEANTALNKIEYAEAKADGKSRKTWHTERDMRVRPTHVLMESKTVPIDEDFIVGGYPMAYPKDSSKGAPPNEIVNCRCSVTYN